MKRLVAIAIFLCACEREHQQRDIQDLPPLAVRSFKVSTLAPQVGERVYFILDADGMALGEIYQGDARVAAYVSPARKSYGMFDIPFETQLYGSFMPVSAATPRIVLAGDERGDHAELAGTLADPGTYCDMDGTWEATVVHNNHQGPAECNFESNLPDRTISLRTLDHAQFASWNGMNVIYDGIELAQCRAVWHFDVGGVTYSFQLWRAHGDDLNYQEIRTLPDGVTKCIDQWGASGVQRVAP